MGVGGEFWCRFVTMVVFWSVVFPRAENVTVGLALGLDVGDALGLALGLAVGLVLGLAVGLALGLDGGGRCRAPRPAWPSPGPAASACHEHPGRQRRGRFP